MKSTLYTILALALLLTPSCQQEKLIPNDTPEESAQNTFVHPVTLTFTATVEDAEYYYAVYPHTVSTTLNSSGNFSVKFTNNAEAATETKGSGGGLSPANAETIAQLKATVPAFKNDTFIAGALLLDGTTIHILGDASAYTEPLGSFNTNASSPEHSYTIVGGEGGGTTTFTTASQSVFNSTPPHIIVRNITFSGCTAGAVKVSAGNVSFDHCVFSGNTATNGGAVSVSGSASSTDDNLKVAFSNCLLTNNSATAANTTGGGAVLVSSGTAGGINGYSIYSSSTNGRFGMNNCTLHAINRTAGSYNAAKNGTQVQASGYSVISNSSLWSSEQTGNRGDKNNLTVAGITPKTDQKVNGIGHTNYMISDKSLFCNAFVPVSRAYVKNAIRSTSVVGELFYDWLESIGRGSSGTLWATVCKLCGRHH